MRRMLAALALMWPSMALAQSPTEEEEEEETIDVRVRGAPPVESPRDRTLVAYLVRRAALEPPGRTLADALASVPGVQIQRSGGSADLATASLRGATSAQSPVYLAGIRLNDELTGTADLSTLPTWMLERIEIFRGHAPAGVDDMGLGGAVLLEPRLGSNGEARSAIGFGSFGEREGRAALSFGDREAGALAAVRYASADGDYSFLDDRGTRFDDGDDVLRSRDNGDHQELDAWAVGRLRSGRSRLVTLVNAYAREAGAPGLQLPGARHTRIAQRRVLAGATGEVDCPRTSAGCRIEIGTDLLLSRYALRDPLRELGGAELTRTEGARVGQRLGARFEVFDGFELGFRGTLRESRIGVDTEDATLVRAERLLVRSEIDAFANVGERLSLALMSALECHATSSGTTDRGCDVLAPVARLGARVDLEPVAILANAGRYLRVPTLGELYGVSATVLGNDALETETGWSLDTGVSAKWSDETFATYGQVVGFARWSDELIAYRRSSLGAVRPYNAASARVLGVEVAAGASLWGVLRAQLAVTLLDPREVSDDRAVVSDLLPYEARLVVAPEVELASPAWPLVMLDTASVAARFRYRSERVADPAGLVVLEAERQLDVDASLLFFGHLGLRGRVANVLDERTFDLVGYPLAGRSFHVLLEGWW
jgi:iron complex outermembrane receptor protein